MNSPLIAPFFRNEDFVCTCGRKTKTRSGMQSHIKRRAVRSTESHALSHMIKDGTRYDLGSQMLPRSVAAA